MHKEQQTLQKSFQKFGPSW